MYTPASKTNGDSLVELSGKLQLNVMALDYPAIYPKQVDIQFEMFGAW